MSDTAPPSLVDLRALRLDTALALIGQGTDQPAPLPHAAASPTAYLQTVVDSLCELSLRDPLSGLANRRHFHAALEREVDRVARSGEAALLMMLDIDHFKRVNDEYGHAVGDAVLRTIAQQLRLGIREGDIACRYGGEEMVLLLPECTAIDAGVRAEAIRIALGGIKPNAEGEGPERITASFGVAAYPVHAQDAEALFWAADKALYRAKEHGRDRVATGA